MYNVHITQHTCKQKTMNMIPSSFFPPLKIFLTVHIQKEQYVKIQISKLLFGCFYQLTKVQRDQRLKILQHFTTFK